MPEVILITEHDEFWFSDGSIVLRADYFLFKVHLSVLARHSKFFKEMLERRTAGDVSSDEEASEERPLLLFVQPEAFADLLSVVYGPHAAAFAAGKAAEELVALIRAAHGYQFSEALQLTMGIARNKIAAPERLAVALDCDIGEWAYDAFRELVLSFDRGLTDLGERITPQTHANILIARERVSVARSLFLLRLPPTEETERGLYGYAAHVIPTTQRERFQEAYLALDADAPRSADWTPIPQAAFEELAPMPAQEEEIVLDVWRTLQKGPDPPEHAPQPADG